MRGVIFDLDQTLVDSRIAEPYRKPGLWGSAYKSIPEFYVYPGIDRLIIHLYNAEIGICIVTSAPRLYCQRVVKYFKWPITRLVCYHDTKRHKPSPEPMIMGLDKLGLTSDEVISIGDQKSDIQSSKSAGVFAIAAAWGSFDINKLSGARPNIICATVDELTTYLFQDASTTCDVLSHSNQHATL